MPENDRLYRERAMNSDQNLLKLYRNIARSYGEIGLISQRDAQSAQNMDSIEAINKIIARVPKMSNRQRLEFCDAFIADDEHFNDATPAILADAYRAISARAKNDTTQRARLTRLAEYIDNESADFANSGGMIIGGKLIDTTNVADVYEGFMDMLRARRADLDESADATKIAQIDQNIAQIESVVGEYDKNWGLEDVKPENASKLEERWDELMAALNHAELSPETKETLKKYNFLDENGNVIPQFLNDGRMDKNGRLAAVIDLVRHDVAKKHLAKFDEDIDDGALESEFNEDALFKLYELDTADKIVNGAIENPEAFTDPAKRDAFIRELQQNGGEISDVGYNAAMDAQVNATAGWAARIKNKLGSAASKVGGFFGKVFQPLKRIDKLSEARMTVSRQKRIDFFARIFKGFASALVASALITTIATAAAATAGISLAASLAMVGIITALGMGVVQVMRWRRAQKEAGLPTDIHAFLADKRLVTSLGVSAIAVAAMCFGAAGMATAAMALGYGALAMGGAKNTIETYKDARNANMSVAESLAWAIANAGAVIAGGFAGRAAAHAGINAYNQRHPENTIFQQDTSYPEKRTETTMRDVTETRTEYTQEALDNAKHIAEMWYRDNPDLLQSRVDAINAYNAEHGTNIDPYRAIMINGDAGGQTADNMMLHVNNSHLDPNINDVSSHGHHRVLTDAWGRAYGYTHDELNSAAHLFDSYGNVNPEAMDVVMRLDANVYADNSVGYVNGRSYHNDNFLHQNDVVRGDEHSANGRVYSTYSDGEPAMVETEYTYQEPVTKTVEEIVPDYTPVDAGGMNMFGVYNPEKRKNQLRDRLGAWMDRLRGNDHRDDDVPPVPPHDDEPEPQDSVIVPVIDEEPKELPAGRDANLLPPAHEHDLIGPKQETGLIPVPTYPEVHEPKLLGPGYIEDYGPELVFAVEYQDAKDYNDFTTNIARERAKRKPDFKKIKRLEQEQRELWNRLGRPEMFEFDRARTAAYQRHKLVDEILELDKHLKNRPVPGKDSVKSIGRWEKRLGQYENRIEELGGLNNVAEAIREMENVLERWSANGTVTPKAIAEMTKRRDIAMAFLKSHGGHRYMDTSNLYYPVPVKSESRAHKEERRAHLDEEKVLRDAAAALERDKQLARGEPINPRTTSQRPSIEVPTEPRAKDDNPFELNITSKKENPVPNPFELNIKTPKQDIVAPQLPTAIAKLRGVSIDLMPIDGRANKIGQSNGHPVVMVNVSGILIVYWLNDSGHWMPSYSTSIKNGVRCNVSPAITEDVAYIGNALDTNIGTDFNADALPKIDTEVVYNSLGSAVYKGSGVYGTYPDSQTTDVEWLTGLLAKIKSKEYEEKYSGLIGGLRLKHDKRKQRRQNNNTFWPNFGGRRK